MIELHEWLWNNIAPYYVEQLRFRMGLHRWQIDLLLATENVEIPNSPAESARGRVNMYVATIVRLSPMEISHAAA